METFWLVVIILASAGIVALCIRTQRKFKRFEDMTEEELADSGWHMR